MKKMLVFLLLAVSVSAFAQRVQPFSDTYKPSTSYAGTLMSLRSVTSSYDDTTGAILTRGCQAVYIGLETSANDSARVLVAYAPSADGVTFASFVALDSLTTTGSVGAIKYFALPANALGAYAVKVRLYGNSDILRYSDSPTTKLTTKVIRVPANLYKVK